MYPVSGGFYTYSTRFISPSWGFAMGWNYVFQWAVVLPFELVVASMTTEYWNEDINVAAWITLFLGVIILINVFGTLGYAEEEFWSSILKLAAIILFMFIGLILGMWFIWSVNKTRANSYSLRWWPKSRNLQRILGCTSLVQPRCFQERLQGYLFRLRNSRFLLLRNRTCWSCSCRG